MVSPRSVESGSGNLGHLTRWEGCGQAWVSAWFRRKVLDLVDAGRPVVDVARDLGITTQSIYSWRRQDRIERSGDRAGDPSAG
jgi:hypothetical protein